MSFPRLTWILLPVGFGLPLLTGACGAPLAVTAASYGADGVSYAASKKTTTDHFASMVTKEDCAFWRIFKNQKVCKPRETDHDPYQVNYDEPFRMQAEGAGVSYGPPLNAQAGAPPVAWEASAYGKPAGDQPQPGTPTTAVAQAPAQAATGQGQSISKAPLEAPAGSEQAAAAPVPTQAAPVGAVAATPSPGKAKKKVASNKTKPKKPSPSQVASVR